MLRACQGMSIRLTEFAHQTSHQQRTGIAESLFLTLCTRKVVHGLTVKKIYEKNVN